jgi:hypothetical protein
MSKQSELNSYITRLQSRLRLRAWVFGSSILVATALVTTITLVLILNHYAFPANGVRGARFGLLLALAIVTAVGIILPLVRLTSSRAVHRAETAFPVFEQRLTTFHERQRVGADPFLELLAADTLTHTQNLAPSSLVPSTRLLAFAGVGLGCLGALVWLIAARPGYMGYGASLLWAGEHKNEAALYRITVAPGDVTVRRHSDQLITAHVVGLHPDKVQVFARYQSTKGWEAVTMEQQPGDSTSYQFVLAGLPENVEYYAAAGPLASQHYNIRVADLPAVKKIQVTYQYPRWTGMKSVTQQQTGDLRAIEGTDAKIEVEMDKPLTSGRLVLDNDKTVLLSAEGANRYSGIIRMDRDGAYHIAAVDQQQPVRLSEDYFIATDKAEPPQVSITRPGGDYRASPIEEVTIGVQGTDSFGLRDLHLHYSVNGGPDHDINMLKVQGAKSSDGSHTLRLEEYKLVPGDLVSLYATAKDGHAESRTNISFIQIDPFEREFSQSQQSGGGGGSGSGQNNQTDMSKREKELIAATWKQQNDKTATPKDAAATGQFLADAQNKLRDQVMALAARMESRDLSSANEEFTGFQTDMQQAAAAMSPSAEKLKDMQWKGALPLEQKALQALLRAEATFRQIQVAFGQQGGGGGSANSAGRDLASLFDLELDTEKNQYETAQNTSPADQRQKEIDDVLAKLDALAKRQEEIANQKNPQQSFQERFQQEMLRREAEQLQREMEQLAQNSQQNNSQSGAQNGSQSPSSQSGALQPRSSAKSSQSASGGSQDQRVQQALSRLRQAGDAMKRNGDQQQRSEAARQASERLHEAKDLLSLSQQQMASSKLGSLSQEADRITQEERAQSDRINRFANQPQVDPMNRESIEARLRDRDQLAGERQRLSDDLSKLQRDLRASARTLAANQPETAQRLNRALTEMDESDLDNRVQRTADWLRRGVNPNSNGTESEIAQGLQKLSQQLREAQKSIARGPQPGQRPGSDAAGQNAALDQVRHLREQLQAMTGDRNSRSQTGSNGQNLGTRGKGQNQQSQAGNGNPRQPGGGNSSSGNSGDIRRGGGGYNGTPWNNINTGNNTYATGNVSGAVPTDAGGNPADVEQRFQQQLNELGRLNQMVQADPGLANEVRDLTRRMQGLDPKRFPGNPALVEQMHREMLSSMNRLELELLNRGATGEARSGKPSSIPDGYQESVAEYYKQLSKMAR